MTTHSILHSIRSFLILGMFLSSCASPPAPIPANPASTSATPTVASEFKYNAAAAQQQIQCVYRKIRQACEQMKGCAFTVTDQNTGNGECGRSKLYQTAINKKMNEPGCKTAPTPERCYEELAAVWGSDGNVAMGDPTVESRTHFNLKWCLVDTEALNYSDCPKAENDSVDSSPSEFADPPSVVDQAYPEDTAV